MTLDRQWLLGVARAEREALGRTIQYTPPDRWEVESACPGWRNRDIVAHLAAQAVAAAAVVAGEPPSEMEEYAKDLDGAPLTNDGFNAFAVGRRQAEPFRGLVREWGQAVDRFLSLSARIPVDQWSSRKVSWVAGDISVGYLVQSLVTEWWLHGEDIRAGAELPPRIEHPPIFCLNDLAIRMIPYALGLAGLQFPGRTLRVELEAAGGGSWLRGVAPGETARSTGVPDVLIEGRADAFALVSGRRVPAEFYLAQGVLQTGGDDALGETILQHVRVFSA